MESVRKRLQRETGMTFVIGMIFLKETNKISIHDETEESYPTPA